MQTSTSSWFYKTFHFHELKPFEKTKKVFQQLLTKDNKINGIDVGKFTTYANSLVWYYTHQYTRKAKKATIRFENIVGSAIDIHNICREGDTIQVASQLNCLEMIDPSKTREDGITIYEYDKTQGPACAMCAPAGLAFRNYLLEEIPDTSSEFKQFLHSRSNNIAGSWRVENGYFIIDTQDQLVEINNILKTSQMIRRDARGSIACGSHTGQGVCIDGENLNKRVNHVYCSGLPISYHNPQKINPELWLGLSELFLEAIYENTILLACYNESSVCYLTAVGGGAFGMRPEQIARAIRRACNVVANAGFSIDVKMVHYSHHINPVYQNIPSVYTFGTYLPFVPSVWDDILNAGNESYTNDWTTSNYTNSDIYFTIAAAASIMKT
jgi:hypothetical protein